MMLGLSRVAMAGGKVVDPFDNYVSHDLIFHIDGIYNLGGKGLADTSNKWVDCVTQTERTINSVVPRLTNGFGPFRTADYIDSNGVSFPLDMSTIFSNRTMTIEGVFSCQAFSANMSNGIGIMCGTYNGISGGATTSDYWTIFPKPTFGPGVNITKSDYGLLHTYSVRIGDGTAWIDGVKVYTNTNIQGTGAAYVSIGAYLPLAIHDARVYSTNLTNAEIQANAAIDLERYKI